MPCFAFPNVPIHSMICCVCLFTVDARAPKATMFMLYHTVLKTSEDYTAALRSAWDLADQLNDYLHKNDDSSSSSSYRVFAYRSVSSQNDFKTIYLLRNVYLIFKTGYHVINISFLFYSIFYVFYEQYLTTVFDTAKALVISVSTVFCVLLLLSGFDVHSSLITLVMICMILVNLFGVMFWWDISFNAVALVNFIMVSHIILVILAKI